MPGLDFLVRRDDLRDVRFEESPIADAELSSGEILLSIDKFGFSANNVTYALMGEAMGYWRFFPGPEGWGRVPVWGFADVARSAREDVHEGERFFGYLPMSTHVVLRANGVNEMGFKRSPMLDDLSSVYQRYLRADNPRQDGGREDLEALWRPLFITSFGVADFLAENDLFDAETIIFSSASSKTALGTAFLLGETEPRPAVLIALTSPSNAAFCERLGYYDRVITYENLRSLPEKPALFVDVGGSKRILRDLRDYLGSNLRKTVALGATQWEEHDPAGGLGDSDSELFFLPKWVETRREQWGPGVFLTRYLEAWERLLPTITDWMKVTHSHGPEAVEELYRELLDGKTSPEIGHILSLTAR